MKMKRRNKVKSIIIFVLLLYITWIFHINMSESWTVYFRPLLPAPNPWYRSNKSEFLPKYEVKIESLTNETKYIFWSDPDNWIRNLLYGVNFNECQVKTCTLHIDGNQYYRSSDAVVFNHPHNIPNYIRPLSQIWAFMIMESPHHISIADFSNEFWKYKFNWTMTYRLDSDIIVGYGSLGRLPTPLNNSKSLDDVIKKKTKLVAWVVSHCVTASNRESYVSELSKYIPVDIYGECGDMDTKLTGQRIFERIQVEYKFYLAFENSICQDYVTEKFFRLQTKDIVLVVMGGGNYRLIAPTDSYIDVRDFPSPKQLAQKLLYLDSNDSEYKKYLIEKSSFTFKPSPNNAMVGLCELCAKLHEPFIKPKVYEDVFKWFSGNSCSSVFDIRYYIRRVFHSLYRV